MSSWNSQIKLVPLEALSTLMQPKGNTSFAWVPQKKEKKSLHQPKKRTTRHAHTLSSMEPANWVLFAAHTKQKYCLLLFFPPYLPHFPGPICVVLEVPIHTFWCCPLHTLSSRGALTHTFWCCPLHTLSPRGAHTHTFWCRPLHTLSPRGAHTHTFWCCPLHTLSPRGAHTHTFWCCPLHTLSPKGAHTHILVLPIKHFEPCHAHLVLLNLHSKRLKLLMRISLPKASLKKVETTTQIGCLHFFLYFSLYSLKRFT